MLVRVMLGRTSDRVGLKRQLDRWVHEVRPGCPGFLGSTTGVTEDGRFVALARFIDEAAARRSLERPEQLMWWTDTEKLFDGDVTWVESTDVELELDGGSDAAGYVEVAHHRGADRSSLVDLEDRFVDLLSDRRPGRLGTIRVWTGDGECFEAAYFADAIAHADAGAGAGADGGAADPVPGLAPGEMLEWARAAGEVESYELEEPWLTS